jgi:predicted dehydrogenase
VGTGFGQHVLAPAFQRVERAEVVAIASRDSDRTRKANESLGVPPFEGDGLALVERDDIDIVAVAVPPEAQGPLALRAKARGKKLFLEKPLGRGVDYWAPLSGLAASDVCVDFEFAEIDVFERVRTLLAEGALGRLHHVQVSWMTETYAVRHQKLDSWKLQPGHGGGVLANLCPHIFYYLERFCGPIESLLCGTDANELYANLHLSFAGGVAGSVSVSTNAPCGSGHVIELYGQRGCLRLENSKGDSVRGFTLVERFRDDSAARPPITTAFQDETGDGRIPACARLIERWLDVLESDAPPDINRQIVPGLAHGLRVETLVEVARRSAMRGAREVV